MSCNNGVGKRIRKRLRRVWYSHVLSCLCVSKQKHENNSCGTSPKSSHDNLQVLLARTLQNQAEEREFQAQLRTTLLYLTMVLERFSISTPMFERMGEFSKIDIATEKSDKTLFTSNNVTTAFGFSPLNSKAVQSKLNAPSGLMTASKLIQTHLLPQFDIVGFKIDLIKHMRALKQDVLSLKQLLFMVDNNNNNYCPWGSHGRFRISREEALWREDELELINFSRAKTRATNFVKFYKLRKKMVKRV